jgi:peptidoglycan/xylan/chitin deacetylase (PgdA/CDA1 family)/N-acetyl-beta-hexosaminidase
MNRKRDAGRSPDQYWRLTARTQLSDVGRGHGLRAHSVLCRGSVTTTMMVLRRSLLVMACTALALALPAFARAAPTVVSLTFDDGWANQTTAASALAAHGMKGTFYVNTSAVGNAGYLSWAQLEAFDAAGNEVTGHTLTHPDLTTLSSVEAQREICDDRSNLVSHGFVATSFAYPFGSYDSTTGNGSSDVSSIVANCGYSSGRGAFGLHNITATSDTRPYAIATPPSAPYKVKTPCCINHAAFGGSTPTAAALQDYVQHAEAAGGGWVAFVFHRICDNCGDDDPAPSMSPAQLDAFLDWLQGPSSGAVVKTVAQVIKNDTQAPSSSISCGGVVCSNSWYGGPVTVALSATDAGTGGVAAIHYTTDGSEPTVNSPTYTGPFTVSATTTVKYRAWDKASNIETTKSQPVRIDAVAPTSSIACNGSSCSSNAYTDAVTVTLSATDAESGVATIRYTTDGSDPTASSTPYSGPISVSETTTIKFRAWDNAGNVETTKSQLVQVVQTPADTEPPTSSIACNGGACLSGWYGDAVTVSLAATDADSGVAAIRYTTDGSDPTVASPAYTAPFTVSATTTVKYRAWDNAGNIEATNSQLIQVDTDTPTSAIACDGATCSSGWYAPGVSVSLSATDTGSGVAAIRYTTDGSDPTTASPTYTAPFTISATTTVKYRAWDDAGNVETTKSKVIQIDATAPTSAIACNGSACSSSTYSAAVTVTLSATDAESGVAVIRYTLDGSNPTTSSTAYSDPITVSETTTVKYRAWDNAGNVEATKSQLVQVVQTVPDTEAPISSIACNLSPCSSGWYGGAVSVTLSAADGGSGVAAIRYTTDGSDPTPASPLYTAPFTVSTTTTVKFRAWDNAGNVEATNSQVIRIDTTAPVSSIRCNGSSCSTGWYNASVAVALSATDAQSGVAFIRYTTNGSNPTTASPAYVGPFTVAVTTTVKYRAWDNAGNVEATKSQFIRIDTTAPTVAMTSPANGATVTGSVKLTANASDAGSGIAQVRFYVDGALIGTKAGSPFTVTWNTKKVSNGQHTLWAVAQDVAGNMQTSGSIQVTVR